MELTFDVLNDRLKKVSSITILWYCLIVMQEDIFFPSRKTNQLSRDQNSLSVYLTDFFLVFLYRSSMLWISAHLALPLLVLSCLLQCPAPTQTDAGKKEKKLSSREATKNQLTVSSKVKMSTVRLKEAARPTTKPSAPTKKATTAKKATTPTPLNEFSLNDILFKGRQSSK